MVRTAYLLLSNYSAIRCLRNICFLPQTHVPIKKMIEDNILEGLIYQFYIVYYLTLFNRKKIVYNLNGD